MILITHLCFNSNKIITHIFSLRSKDAFSIKQENTFIFTSLETMHFNFKSIYINVASDLHHISTQYNHKH